MPCTTPTGSWFASERDRRRRAISMPAVAAPPTMTTSTTASVTVVISNKDIGIRSLAGRGVGRTVAPVAAGSRSPSRALLRAGASKSRSSSYAWSLTARNEALTKANRARQQRCRTEPRSRCGTEPRSRFRRPQQLGMGLRRLAMRVLRVRGGGWTVHPVAAKADSVALVVMGGSIGGGWSALQQVPHHGDVLSPRGPHGPQPPLGRMRSAASHCLLPPACRSHLRTRSTRRSPSSSSTTTTFGRVRGRADVTDRWIGCLRIASVIGQQPRSRLMRIGYRENRSARTRRHHLVASPRVPR